MQRWVYQRLSTRVGGALDINGSGIGKMEMIGHLRSTILCECDAGG